jgi:Transposase and inactivated derivatives
MGTRRKYSYEQKLESVLDVLESGQSLYHVSKQLGADHKQVRTWVALYEHHGEKGLRICRRPYSEEFKLSVLDYMQKNSLSLFKTAVIFGIPDDGTVSNWNRKYNQLGATGLICGNKRAMGSKSKKTENSEQSREELLSELRMLRTENAYLKKLRALVQERIARENVNGLKPSKN